MCDIFHEILNEKGLRKIASLHYRIWLDVWWHSKAKIEVILLQLGSKAIVKGSKPYYLKSISEEGETWLRDIGPLQNYLEGHFPELHISFSYIRDISDTLAIRQIRDKFAVERQQSFFPSVKHLALLQEAEKKGIKDSAELADLLKEDSGSYPSLQSYIKHQINKQNQEIQQLRTDIAKQQAKHSLFENLQKQYIQKSSAACFIFSLTSNIQLTTSPSEFRDALASILKELVDGHRFQVVQKLGGKLNIQIQEAYDPVMAWLEEWFGGALSPRQVSKFKDEFELIQNI